MPQRVTPLDPEEKAAQIAMGDDGCPNDISQPPTRRELGLSPVDADQSTTGIATAASTDAAATQKAP